MRLICPNCGAQYEVPDGVVPHEGRDVQCSNCGNTWFQAHPDNDQALTDELNPPQVDEPDQASFADQTDDSAAYGAGDESGDTNAEDAVHPEAQEPDWDAPETDDDEWQGFDEDTAADDHSVEADKDTPDHGSNDLQDDAADHHEDQTDDQSDADSDGDDQSDDISTPDHVPPARELDPSIADILQQEAQHEAQARASETLESQPDLGLDDAASDVDQRTREANERMARLRGDTPLEESVAATVAASSRRDLLPDIEEINSTLRSTTDRKSGITEDLYDDELEAPRKSGRFRRGFWMIILAAIVLLLIYVFAPTIVKALPALEGVMTSYVALVDQLRAWLDGRVQSMLQWLDTKASNSGS